MPKAKSREALVGGTADDVEAAFYEALQAADLEKLMACWSDDDDIVCVHPGGPRIVGPGAIRLAFESIFAQANIRATPERVRKIEALASAVHNVLERIDVLTESGPAQAYVLATNVYHKTAQGWRMVLHHASPGSQSEAQEISEAPHLLH